MYPRLILNDSEDLLRGVALQHVLASEIPPIEGVFLSRSLVRDTVRLVFSIVQDRDTLSRGDIAHLVSCREVLGEQIIHLSHVFKRMEEAAAHILKSRETSFPKLTSYLTYLSQIDLLIAVATADEENGCLIFHPSIFRRLSEVDAFKGVAYATH